MKYLMLGIVLLLMFGCAEISESGTTEDMIDEVYLGDVTRGEVHRFIDTDYAVVCWV